MSVITQEMKELLGSNQCFVATADKNGEPSVAPKGSAQVISDDTIAFAEIAGGKTYHNIQANPRAAVVVLGKGECYRFVGQTELVTSGPVFDKYVETFQQRNLPKPMVVIQIKIDGIYDLSVKKLGAKVG
ncbi:MAG: pyridoxamine 5'-phosphate oxidase family protein [Firmicutes bacterium]|nr:pyridoxamine 5'-phosphate oxidase family protein [Bacillota bacterium]